MAIEFNVDAALAKLAELVQAHGPEAVDMAARVVQVNAINALTGVPVWGALAAAAFWGGRVLNRRHQRLRDSKSSGYPDYYSGEWMIAVCLLAAAGVGCFLGAVVLLVDVWTWVGIFNPKLALAHQVLQHLAGVQ